MLKMSRFAALFNWRRRKEQREKGVGLTRRQGLFRRSKSRKRKQERKAEQAEQAEQAQQAQQAEQAQQAQQMQEREEKAEQQSDSGDSCVCNVSRVSTRPSWGSYSDLDDEVFVGGETCSLNPPATPPLPQNTSHDDHQVHDLYDDSVSAPALTGARRHSKTLPATLLQLPTIIVEEEQQQQQQQQQEGYGSRSPGHARHRSDSHVPLGQIHLLPPSPPPPQRLPEVMFDEHAIQAASGRKAYLASKKAPFKVKYTKVYGEADGAYSNDSRPRGLVFVCNFVRFKNNKYSQRAGSEKDFDNLVNLFNQMGYKTDHRRRRYCLTGSINKKEFLQRLQEFVGEVKHKMLCSCVVILMSHGTGPRTFVTSDNLEVDLLDVYKIFDNINCPNLKGKPKVFILQFCRGQEASATPAASGQEMSLPGSPRSLARQPVSPELLEKMVKKHVSLIMQDYLKQKPALLHPGGGDNGQELQKIKERSRQASVASLTSAILEADQREDGDAAAAVGGGSVEEDLQGTCEVDGCIIPSREAMGLQRYSDMYSIFSTSPGELSHRHPTKGSLLIQAICHVFAEYAYQDEIDMLGRRVSNYMTKTLQRDDPITVPRQTCERTNNGLDKPFYFNPYEMAQNRQFTI